MKNRADVMKDLLKVRRRRITIQKKIDDFDEIGNPIEVWSNWKSLKAEQTSLWGQEYYAAKAVGEERTIVFTVKYVSFLDELNSVEYRIVVDGKAYDIKHIDPIQDDGMWMKIKAISRPTDIAEIRITDHKLVRDLQALVEAILTDENIEISQETLEYYGTKLAETLEGW